MTDGELVSLLCTIKRFHILHRNLNNHPEKEANDCSVNLLLFSFAARVSTEPELKSKQSFYR